MNTTFEVRKITKSWNKNSASWDNLAEFHDSKIIDSKKYTSGEKKWYEFNITETIKEYFLDPTKNFGFMIFNKFSVSNTNSGALSKFYNEEAKTTTNRPKLTITYTLPSSIKSQNKANSFYFFYVKKSGNIIVNSSEKLSGKILVYSPKGKLLKRFMKPELKDRISIKLCNGIYLIQLINNKGINITKTISIIN